MKSTGLKIAQGCAAAALAFAALAPVMAHADNDSWHNNQRRYGWARQHSDYSHGQWQGYNSQHGRWQHRDRSRWEHRDVNRRWRSNDDNRGWGNNDNQRHWR